MHSVFDKLANGEISIDNAGIQLDPESKQILKAIHKKGQKLFAMLSDDEKAMFEEISEAQTELENLSAINGFIYGYKLGVVMTAEVFVKSGELIVG